MRLLPSLSFSLWALTYLALGFSKTLRECPRTPWEPRQEEASLVQLPLVHFCVCDYAIAITVAIAFTFSLVIGKYNEFFGNSDAAVIIFDFCFFTLAPISVAIFLAVGIVVDFRGWYELDKLAAGDQEKLKTLYDTFRTFVDHLRVACTEDGRKQMNKNIAAQQTPLWHGPGRDWTSQLLDADLPARFRSRAPLTRRFCKNSPRRPSKQTPVRCWTRSPT